jgi:hypothetical protein
VQAARRSGATFLPAATQQNGNTDIGNADITNTQVANTQVANTANRPQRSLNREAGT